MIKKIGLLVFVLSILMSFFTISAFATENGIGNTPMPFVESENISPEYPHVYAEGDLVEDFEEMFGEAGSKILSVAMVGALFMFLFLPALLLVIVFGVLNGKTKKKIEEYERFFGPVPQNIPYTYNSNPYNYQQQPINPSNVPMGNAPIGNYVPQGDMNNQQGGSF